MANIKSFKAMRFSKNAGNIKDLVCPPYDIISEEERKDFLAHNEHNIIRLELPKDGENPYITAGEQLLAERAEKILINDSEYSLYIYEEKFTALGKTHSFKGIVARVKLEPFEKGIILPHEQTLSKAKEDRYNLMCATNCNFSQIYSLYMDDEHKTAKKIDALSVGAPLESFTDNEGVTHSLYIITDENTINDITSDFLHRKLYIADGHHRYETALKYKDHIREITGACKHKEIPTDYVMMMLVDMQNDGLVVFPTHRVVRGLENFDITALLEKCKEYFYIKEVNADEMQSCLDAEYEKGLKSFICYCCGKYHLLTLKDINVMKEFMPNDSMATRNLDVSVLHTLVLERIFSIDKENMANQINLTYTKSAEEAVSAADNGANCAFIINPTRVDEIRDVAAAGEKMPQKSTYFYPKLITGLVMNSLDV